jgi:hypothetical protein
MRILIIILLAMILSGCKATYVYNVNDGPSTYHSFYNPASSVYYWNGSPYYGFWDGYYYYYGYPHTYPWSYYYSYQPPCWYRPHLHVVHNVVYVVPVNGWKYNNRKGGEYQVPEKFHAQRTNESKPHSHIKPKESQSPRPQYEDQRKPVERKPATVIRESRPITPAKPTPAMPPTKQPTTKPSREVPQKRK